MQKLLYGVLFAGLAYSFWYSPAWLQLCYGLALFLFGMQCIEEGLQNAASGTLQKMMEKSTSTPIKGVLFGMGATFILQSTTLVSLLTIAFLSAGLIQLAGGIAIILGTNLGATSGIWLLAWAGQSISLSPIALPMLIFGILASFIKGKSKAFGRILVGIALIFIGIDAIKDGFQTVGGLVDFAAIQVNGITEIILFSIIGLLLTIMLQSTHATLILTLAALSGGQISLIQAFALAIGSNVGSSIATAVVGMLGSERGGQRLAMAHLLFNVVTAVLSLLLWLPLTALVKHIALWLGMGNLLQLALFHTLFNVLGLSVFWFLQKTLATHLVKWLPESPELLLAENNGVVTTLKHERGEFAKARYLSTNMLRSGDTALNALLQEIRHLSALCLEVICHVLFIPPEHLYQTEAESTLLLPIPPLKLDAQQLYERQIKPLYGEILEFSSRAEVDDETSQQQLMQVHMTALQLVGIVKDSKHMQKNMQHYLQASDHPLHEHYVSLRNHVFHTLWLFRHTAALPIKQPEWRDGMALLVQQIDLLETGFRQRVLVRLRNNELDGWHSTSLINDINYTRRIDAGLYEILHTAANNLPEGEPTLPNIVHEPNTTT